MLNTNEKLLVIDINDIVDCMINNYGYNHKDKFTGYSDALLNALELHYYLETRITKQLDKEVCDGVQ